MLEGSWLRSPWDQEVCLAAATLRLSALRDPQAFRALGSEVQAFRFGFGVWY